MKQIASPKNSMSALNASLAYFGAKLAPEYRNKSDKSKGKPSGFRLSYAWNNIDIEGIAQLAHPI
jgi:hypothetical protein